MGVYEYTSVSDNVPAIPLLDIQLITPNFPASAVSVECQAILDTGSDCTLIPIPLLVQVQAKARRNAIRIPIGGISTLGVSYEVGLIFDRYSYSTLQVFGCPVDDIGELLIIGRDVMNRHCIEFDGNNLAFTIF